MKVWVAHIKSDLGMDFDATIGLASSREGAKQICWDYEAGGTAEPEEVPEAEQITWDHESRYVSQGVGDSGTYTVEEFNLDA